ncbi:helix-turn-helix transcriptional regulator [Cumulibacter manganitolerans]|uniref:helix-turn-helix transcriptional regulator n=1 Tax=Cumulibacter manganitolerans TaxID=1884992 RepID=UPI001E5FD854|nr:AraC family transcriptional regulator [Cumulibacter manganitolerans]
MTAQAGDRLPVQRCSFFSQDEGEVTEFIREMYVDNRSRFLRIGERAQFGASVTEIGQVATGRIRSTVDYAADTEPFDYFLALAVHHGHLRVRSGKQELTIKAGDLSYYPIGVPLHIDLIDVGGRTLRLPMSLLGQVAEETTGIPAACLRFEGSRPVSAARRRYWKGVLNLVTGAMSDADTPLAAPLMADQMQRLAAVAALHTFPNSALAHQEQPRPVLMKPAALRRAVAYIESHAAEPISLTDLAAVAQTSPRALQYAFRSHYQTTPLGYLRRVRLEHAHRDLQAADPGAGHTVAAIAARWGFLNPGRFAALYRDTYGTPPNLTLKH